VLAPRRAPKNPPYGPFPASPPLFLTIKFLSHYKTLLTLSIYFSSVALFFSCSLSSSRSAQENLKRLSGCFETFVRLSLLFHGGFLLQVCCVNLCRVTRNHWRRTLLLAGIMFFLLPFFAPFPPCRWSYSIEPPPPDVSHIYLDPNRFLLDPYDEDLSLSALPRFCLLLVLDP